MCAWRCSWSCCSPYFAAEALGAPAPALAPAPASPAAEPERWPLGRTLASPFAAVARDAALLATAPLRWEGRDWARAGGLLAATGLLYVLDQDIQDEVRRHRNSGPVDWLADAGKELEAMGEIHTLTPYLGAGVAAGYVAGWQPLTTASWQLLESLHLASLLRWGVVEVVGRSRPRTGRGKDEFRFGKGGSFPSGHASNAFQVATILSHHLGRWWATAALYGMAGTVAVERVASDLHWTSDAVFAAVYGTAMAHGLIHLHEREGVGLRPVRLADGSAGVAMVWGGAHPGPAGID